MNCLSCQIALTAQTTQFFRKKVILCADCAAFAEKQAKELEAASARALTQSMIWLEQRILSGQLRSVASHDEASATAEDSARDQSSGESAEGSQ